MGGEGTKGPMAACAHEARKATIMRAPASPPAAAAVQPPMPHDHRRMSR
jgi:hypothetical protein